MNKEDIVPYLKRCNEFRYGVICGLAKSGTSLPLTLLDSHPTATVFPEELRFMDSGCQHYDNQTSLAKFLANGNTLQLEKNQINYNSSLEHQGTGYGERDYSNIDFSLFCEILTTAFAFAETIQQRYFSIFLAFEIAKGGSFKTLKQRPLLISKAPHNEVYMTSWEKMLGNKAYFIWMIRDPFEHFLSMKKTAQKFSKTPIAVSDFCELVNSRYTLMTLQRSATIFIRYEDLITNTKNEMTDLANFLDITFEQSLLTPTKNSFSWQGNSSRGIQKNSVFANPNIAKEELSLDEILAIEHKNAEYIDTFQY